VALRHRNGERAIVVDTEEVEAHYLETRESERLSLMASWNGFEHWRFAQLFRPHPH
jgi:hypothetical protein